MRLFSTMGNEVRRYTESPGLALRVEMPFSKTTPNRVPAGTTRRSPGAALRCGVGRAAGATETGAEVCGPGGSCATATHPPQTVDTTNQALRANPTRCGKLMTSSVPLDAMRARTMRMPEYISNTYRVRQ